MLLICILLITIENINCLGSQFGESSKKRLKFGGIFNRNKNNDYSNLKVTTNTIEVPVDHFNATFNDSDT